ncbi:uncharacterized protein E0L32_008011 [Thyridium curvatum]|uniref:Stc1 domain-containing protein n=1 Tax=Thyridium curvatum TaxID=1093900 RepID=A0A507AX07_9PEZI|nr:uncharacterized protein E0L32_008011 [Thyridium curvatum]TPX10974.1 hypothetical protein E0L32_008011 [Thyridium curvatum]
MAENGTNKIRCSTGGEWRARGEFSKNQLRKYDENLRKRSPGVTAADSGINCLEHSGNVAKELRCKGPCQQWLAFSQFSKRTRKMNRNWCLQCTAWQLSQEPGYIPFAAPNNVLSLDEKRKITESQDHIFLEALGSHSPAEDDQSSDETMTTSAAAQHDVFSEIRFDPEAVQPLSEATLAACNAKMYATETTRTVAATEDSRPTCSDFVSTFQTSVTGTTSKDLADSDTGTSVAATTPQASHNGAEATPFNAWGPNGQPATRRKAVTVVSAVTSTVGGTRPRDRPDGPSGWARPSTRKTELLVPAYVTQQGFFSDPVSDWDSDDSPDEC